MTTALQCSNSPKPSDTLAGFEPGIFCSIGGRDDHYTTPPGQIKKDFANKTQSQNLNAEIFFSSFQFFSILFNSDSKRKPDSTRKKEMFVLAEAARKMPF
jgi:hypothetical protein